MARRRVTSFDVAEAAGVSRTTVSFVLNSVSNQTIPDKTRLAVLDAAEKLGYTPSAAAKALRAGSSRLVLVLGPHSQPSELMDAGMAELTLRLRRAGYATVIAMSAGDAENLDVLWQSVSPAAIVSMFDMPTPVRERIRAMRIPIVDALFHTAESMPGQFELQVDVGRQQAEHVIAGGATDIVYAAPAADQVEPEILADRSRGVRERAERAGVGFSMLQVPRIDSVDAVHPDVRALRSAAGRRIAVCAYNDLSALAVIRLAQEADLTAPRDFAVIGVDDIAAAEFTTPTLSSVRFQIVEHIGRIATTTIALLDGTSDIDVPTSPVSVVVARESTAPQGETGH